MGHPCLDPPLGGCGLNEQVSYRAAYLFKNFVQPLKAHVAPLVAELYPALQAALARGTSPAHWWSVADWRAERSGNGFRAPAVPMARTALPTSPPAQIPPPQTLPLRKHINSAVIGAIGRTPQLGWVLLLASPFGSQSTKERHRPPVRPKPGQNSTAAWDSGTGRLSVL